MNVYRPPEFSKAYDLIEEIMSFLEDCGGPYIGISEQIEETKYHGIILSVLHGQFIYRKGWYFASWFRATDESLEQIKKYVMPEDVTTGDILYIVESGVKQGMSELVTKIKKRNPKWESVYWHRYKSKQWKHFRRTS
jgi:hypothetical protein